MSAIFGILRFDGGSVSERDLQRVANTLAHRGPDGVRSAVDGPVGIGHCLMRVNQEDFCEVQPLRDRAADVTLVADLRLDNREELASAFALETGELRDMPDSALVLRAYRKWGADCAEHLLGDFAFAIWDGRAKKLVLGRDHMGQRYVHYHRGKNFFAFATEIRALWALADVPRALSETQLSKYLVLEPRSPEGASLFEDISGILSGTTLAVDRAGGTVVRRYWEPQAASEHIGREEAYYIETYRRILTEAVECRIRRLRTPPALCLSAGYDSAAIAGLSGPLLTANGRKLITVSSVLPEDYHGPLPCARRWVELCRRDMPHLDVRYLVRGDETIFTKIERSFLAANGVPRIESYVVDALFREAASAGARLIMDGLGGDSTLNQRGGGALAHFLRTRQFERFLSEFAPHLRMSGHSLWETLRRDVAGPFIPRWLGRSAQAVRRGFAPVWSTSPIAPAFANAALRSGAIDETRMLGQYWLDTSMRARMLQTLRNWMASSDRNEGNQAAAHGLDVTRPFVDKRVVEFGLAIPENLYVKNGRNRYLACLALADVYPVEFQTRGRHQDLIEPDLIGMLKTAEPVLTAAVRRMANSPTLRGYIDFRKLEEALDISDIGRAPLSNTALALRAFRAAQYVEWLEGKNR